MNQRLIHDAAMMMAQAILDKVEGHLTYEERLQAIYELYLVCKAGVEAYEVQASRMQKRLNPTSN